MEQQGLFVEDQKHQPFVQISKAHKLAYYLLTSRELGFKHVHMEVPILNGLTYADIYIEDINLALMINGPRHYFRDRPDLRIPLLYDSLINKHVNCLDLSYEIFKPILDYGTIVGHLSESNFQSLKEQLSVLIKTKLK